MLARQEKLRGMEFTAGKGLAIRSESGYTPSPFSIRKLEAAMNMQMVLLFSRLRTPAGEIA